MRLGGLLRRPFLAAMGLYGSAVCACACGLAVGCRSEQAPPAVSAAAASSTAAMDADSPPAQAIEQLGDPRQAVRDRAAGSLRRSMADKADAGDPGEAFWKPRLAAVRPGITAEQFEKETRATLIGSGSSGRSTTSIFRLDDYWVVTAYFDEPDRLREVGALARSAREVWVEPPPSFSGKWVTYFVNGSPAHDNTYQHGRLVRTVTYHANGQLAFEQRYVEGKPDGPEVGYHPEGKKAYEIRHALGKQVGRAVFWWPNGNLQSDKTYVDGQLDGTATSWREDGTKSTRVDYRAGKETGQAAWDEHGTLLYAHGSAEQSPDR